MSLLTHDHTSRLALLSICSTTTAAITHQPRYSRFPQSRSNSTFDPLKKRPLWQPSHVVSTTYTFFLSSIAILWLCTLCSPSCKPPAPSTPQVVVASHQQSTIWRRCRDVQSVCCTTHYFHVKTTMVLFIY